MSFRKWQKLMAAKTPNAVALDLLMEETRVAVWLDTFSSLAGGADAWPRLGMPNADGWTRVVRNCAELCIAVCLAVRPILTEQSQLFL
jgi:hypothetical protein